MSLPYSVAVALLEGGALLSQYQPEKLRHPEIARLARMVTSSPTRRCRAASPVRWRSKCGAARVYRSQVDHPRGSIANPMTADDMDNKVHLLADDVIGRTSVNTLIDMVRNITTVSRIGELTRVVAQAPV